jgi:hypothetical protein
MGRGASPAILIPPIAPGHGSSPHGSAENSGHYAADAAIDERCDTATLRQEVANADCVAVDRRLDERGLSVEATLLNILGYERIGAGSVTEQASDLRDADTLAAEAGTGQGARAAEAAAIIASQRGGTPPSAPSPR